MTSKYFEKKYKMQQANNRKVSYRQRENASSKSQDRNLSYPYSKYDPFYSCFIRVVFRISLILESSSRNSLPKQAFAWKRPIQHGKGRVDSYSRIQYIAAFLSHLCAYCILDFEARFC